MANRWWRGGVRGGSLRCAMALLAAVALTAGACGNRQESPQAPPVEPPAVATSAAPSPDPVPTPSPDPVPAPSPTPPTSTTGTTTAAPTAAPTDDSPAVEPDPGEETEPPAGLAPEVEARLVELLAELAGIATEWNPSGRASLAVASADGTLYGVNENRRHVSASAVKPLWAAAAIDLAGLEAVGPLAAQALVASDNFAAGEIIDLIGIDTVNTWSTAVAGLADTHLAAWHFGVDRRSQSVIDGGSRGNLTTVADLALFYARLHRNELLDPAEVAALEGWLRETPRTSVDGALLARLPAEVAGEAVHKAGWLPPYCCPVDVRLVIDAGIVPLPGGGWFSIAAVNDRGEAYNLSVRWVALAACRVYVLLAGDGSHTCGRPGDGVPRPELWPPPAEPEEEPEPGDGTEAVEEPEPGDGTETDAPEDRTEDADRPGTVDGGDPEPDSQAEPETEPEPGAGDEGVDATEATPTTETTPEATEPETEQDPEPAGGGGVD